MKDLDSDEAAEFIGSQLYLAKVHREAMNKPPREGAQSLIKTLEQYQGTSQKYQAKRMRRILGEMLESNAATEEITSTIAVWETWRHDSEMQKMKAEEAVISLKKDGSPFEI